MANLKSGPECLCEGSEIEGTPQAKHFSFACGSPSTAAVRPRKGESKIMSSITSKPNKAVALAQVQALVAGTLKHFPNGSFTLGNTAYTTATLVQALQSLEQALGTINAAQTSAKDAVTALHGVEATVGPLMRDYKRFVLAAFSTATQQLADFGLQAPKARKPLSSEKRVAATAKLKATRLARGTTSRKQKLAVKGNVTGVVVTTVTNAPASSPAASPAAIPLERIRQPGEVVSDRDCSIFRKGISIGRRRCLYLRRWNSRTSSGRPFDPTFPSRSGREQQVEVGDHGETRATFSTGSYGSCERVLLGPTCLDAIRRTRPATTAFRSGSARASWTEFLPRSPRTFGSAARWT
jgi:hypothetical protein